MPSNRQQPIIITGAVLAILIQPIAWSNVSLDRTSSRLSIKLHFNSKALTDPPTPGTDIQYTPPNRGAPEITASGGTRLLPTTEIEDGGNRTETIPPSCSQSQVVLLVPQNHVGLTVSARPRFFWYVSDAKLVPIKFELKQVGSDRTVWKDDTLRIPAAGIIELKMPENEPELTEGQNYFWSVSVACKADSGEVKTKVVKAAIRRVALTEELTRRLASAPSDRDRAKIYAQNGLWYDALEQLYTASKSKPNEESIHNAFFSLLEQAGLKQVTELVRQN
ncbi:DUF928 domain-containing protein [Argonema antarcticum]|uniref:DUF928 domain-containing protein n=1 Tax=Argonema antarcticum TaxID=2942763 RepID=UPI0020126DA1|nr:DUF928 domain-containing protein [Argonema antarcticum]MCL1472803.1 DUF928 domain-containing protein [Argonema antarcticum A004/B2]